jgi:hypothetical protein
MANIISIRSPTTSYSNFVTNGGFVKSHQNRVVDERPLRAKSGHSITAHYANAGCSGAPYRAIDKLFDNYLGSSRLDSFNAFAHQSAR